MVIFELYLNKMDKELALIIAEILIKQDETTAQLKSVAARVDNVVAEVNNVVVGVDNVAVGVNNVVVGVNKVAVEVNNVVVGVKETNSILKDFMSISVKQWEQQHKFNEIIVGELKGIKEVLSILSQLETRLKAIEERETKFENRLANIEKLLKAS